VLDAHISDLDDCDIKREVEARIEVCHVFHCNVVVAHTSSANDNHISILYMSSYFIEFDDGDNLPVNHNAKTNLTLGSDLMIIQKSRCTMDRLSICTIVPVLSSSASKFLSMQSID
jgi:hypothetical protein